MLSGSWGIRGYHLNLWKLIAHVILESVLHYVPSWRSAEGTGPVNILFRIDEIYRISSNIPTIKSQVAVAEICLIMWTGAVSIIIGQNMQSAQQLEGWKNTYWCPFQHPGVDFSIPQVGIYVEFPTFLSLRMSFRYSTGRARGGCLWASNPSFTASQATESKSPWSLS